MKQISLRLQLIIGLLFITFYCIAQTTSRETTLIDKDWRFNFGHPFDTEKDFGHGEAYFSYLAKTGNGDGPAAAFFDDRSWRLLDLPHDWAVEQSFSEEGSFSHGFKEAGKGFPEKSIGWYRKKIAIPQEDLGRIITLKFDGVFRNSKVFFNGYFLGTEESGYDSFEYDVTEYVNYGGENTISVRVDASMKEGWFYEGAGIYRHVWLQKTNPLHVAQNGTYITTEVHDGYAMVTALATIINKGNYKGDIEVTQTLLNPEREKVTSVTEKGRVPGFYKNTDFTLILKVTNPKLWDLETPNLYCLVTEVKQNGRIIDRYETMFGIRSLRFDPETGFYLNGKSVKLKGTNNHQDHAGVGTAIPDELQYWRIKQLKDMESNAYRCSHHPPTPELLEACDRLGMLVIDETRLMGINEYHLGSLKRMIERDRNHPSIICWSVGNEEWNIEGNIIGERITQTMQEYSHSLDSTRPVTVGISSGFRSGISSVVEVMGYNYLGNGDIDAHRNYFKQQPGMGTEEGSTFATRGVYFTDDDKHYKAAYDKKPRPTFYSIEEGWKFYAERPYLSGMFIWTGFDYRGEPTPYGWPSVTSYFGMIDVCGFPKDNFYYLKSWWGSKPVLHIFPHWNWKGKEGEDIPVWIYSNCDEAELFLNNRSLGRKKIERNGHLEWQVPYKAGELKAIGYKNGKKILTQIQKTTGEAKNVKLTPHKKTLTDSNDLAIVTVEVTDKNGLHVATADNDITFSIKGGGKIIGVGNGNPTSLEKDKFLDVISLINIEGLQEQGLSSEELPNLLVSYPDSNWKEAFKDRNYKNQSPSYVYKGNFELIGDLDKDKITFFYKKIGTQAVVFVNGNKVTASAEDPLKFVLTASVLKKGTNTMHIVATPVYKKHDWDVVNTNPGVIQVITPAEDWHRKLFNGYAQLIVQADGSGDEIILTAKSENLKSTEIVIKQ